MPAKKSSSAKVSKSLEKKFKDTIVKMVLSGPQLQNILKKSAQLYRDAFQKDENTTNINEGSGSDDGLMLGITDKRDDATANETYAIEPPDAYTRMFAVKYLPLAWRITHGVSADCFKSGEDYPFNFVYAQEHDVEKTNWSDDLLTIMRNINYINASEQCMGNGRQDGEAVLVLIEDGFDWKTTDTSKERNKNLPIQFVMAVPMYYVNYGVSVKQDDWNMDGSPKYYQINLGASITGGRQSGKSQKWHYSRVIHHTPKPVDTDPRGLCVLDRCWQAILIGFNIDLACGEFAFRWGMGHPVFETPFTDQKDLERFMSMLGNPTRRTWHALLKDMKLTFAGPNGSPAGLDVIKEKCCYDEVIVGTGEPKPILKGEVAGVQTGSEVNERSHWGVLMCEQTAYNKVHWKMTAILNETQQITIPEMDINWEYNTVSIPVGLNIKWTVHYVETEAEKIKILNEKLDAPKKIADWSTFNECRALTRELCNWTKEDYPDLPSEIGDQLVTTYQSPAQFGSENEEENPNDEPEDEPEKKPEKTPGKKEKNLPEEKETPKKVNGKTDIGPIVGCPDHNFYNRTCPMCEHILHQKMDMAMVLLQKGYTPKRTSDFLHLDYNKVVELRNAGTGQTATI